MKEFAGVKFHSAKDILANPHFPGARAAYIDAVVALYESNPAMIELMLDAGRILVFGCTMCLWGRYREAEQDTWPTVRRPKEAVALFQVASRAKLTISSPA